MEMDGSKLTRTPATEVKEEDEATILGVSRCRCCIHAIDEHYIVGHLADVVNIGIIDYRRCEGIVYVGLGFTGIGLSQFWSFSGLEHTCQVLGSTFQDKCSDVQRMTEQQGLSPKGRKQTRHKPHQPLTSMSNTSNRPMTRSKSKDNSQIDMVRIHLQMDQAASNPNGKIWLFWSNEVNGHILEQHDQHITITFKYTDISDKFMMSFIYAICKDFLRRPMWDRLLFYANMELPWCTIGDFNVITSIEEKMGDYLTI
ncbi:hypothetical protein H5410_030645 [Solanum commersonii]|uniref:Uncharacterized protein n=1 Tax=Solanum commersonii TaxID=4109 RepID=A0A9J5YEV8_SOLCO|nr:hypothetical protein H5410_030645 [Solanum commersonii]